MDRGSLGISIGRRDAAQVIRYTYRIIEIDRTIDTV